MKNKWNHEVINSQEDEDGFSLNPGSVFHYESAKGEQEINLNRGSADTAPCSAKLVMISPGAGRRISQLIISSSANLQSQ